MQTVVKIEKNIKITYSLKPLLGRGLGRLNHIL